MLEYHNLIEVLEKHLCPKKNILVAQFLSIYQNENQSLAEYIALLRRDIGDCDFVSSCDCRASVTEIFSRAQFIRGIRDNSIREQLLQSNISAFKDIVEKALALEASKIDSRELQRNQPSSNLSNHLENVKRVTKQRNSRCDNSTLNQRTGSRSPTRQKYFRPRSK